MLLSDHTKQIQSSSFHRFLHFHLSQTKYSLHYACLLSFCSIQYILAYAVVSVYTEKQPFIHLYLAKSQEHGWRIILWLLLLNYPENYTTNSPKLHQHTDRISQYNYFPEENWQRLKIGIKTKISKLQKFIVRGRFHKGYWWGKNMLSVTYTSLWKPWYQNPLN